MESFFYLDDDRKRWTAFLTATMLPMPGIHQAEAERVAHRVGSVTPVN
jgi:hypothetical protein